MKGQIFFLIGLILQYELIISYKCKFDSIKRKPKTIKYENKDDKRALSNDYSPIKIKLDYTYLESQNKLTYKDLNDLKYIFNEIVNYLSSLFSVVHIDLKLDKDLINYSCDISKYGSDIENTFYSYDLLIFPIINTDLEEGVLAQAWECLSTQDNKPVAGVVEINQYFSLNKVDSEYYMKYLLLHEISHILGFNSELFRRLNLLYTERENGEIKTYINSKRVIEMAKLHFNCENIKGILLENQGGEGYIGII